MVNVAGDREQASRRSAFWAKSRFHRGLTDISVWPKFDRKTARELKITHAICKISRSCAFVRNNLNYCQIKLIFVQWYNDIPNKQEGSRWGLSPFSHGSQCCFTWHIHGENSLHEIVSACQCMTAKPCQRAVSHQTGKMYQGILRVVMKMSILRFLRGQWPSSPDHVTQQRPARSAWGCRGQEKALKTMRFSCGRAASDTDDAAWLLSFQTAQS